MQQVVSWNELPGFVVDAIEDLTFVGSMEKPTVSEGNPRFPKPYANIRGSVRIKYGSSTGLARKPPLSS